MDVNMEEPFNGFVVAQPKMSTNEVWQRAVAQLS